MLLGPLGVVVNVDAAFVGVPVAEAFAQAGLLILIVGGVYSYGLALFLLCLRARRSLVLGRGVATAGTVVAVLLVGAYVGAPAFLLPLCVLLAGATGSRPVAKGRAPIPDAPPA